MKGSSSSTYYMTTESGDYHTIITTKRSKLAKAIAHQLSLVQTPNSLQLLREWKFLFKRSFKYFLKYSDTLYFACKVIPTLGHASSLWSELFKVENHKSLSPILTQSVTSGILRPPVCEKNLMHQQWRNYQKLAYRSSEYKWLLTLIILNTQVVT